MRLYSWGIPWWNFISNIFRAVDSILLVCVGNHTWLCLYTPQIMTLLIETFLWRCKVFCVSTLSRHSLFRFVEPTKRRAAPPPPQQPQQKEEPEPVRLSHFLRQLFATVGIANAFSKSVQNRNSPWVGISSLHSYRIFRRYTPRSRSQSKRQSKRKVRHGVAPSFYIAFGIAVGVPEIFLNYHYIRLWYVAVQWEMRF